MREAVLTAATRPVARFMNGGSLDRVLRGDPAARACLSDRQPVAVE